MIVNTHTQDTPNKVIEYRSAVHKEFHWLSSSYNVGSAQIIYVILDRFTVAEGYRTNSWQRLTLHMKNKGNLLRLHRGILN